MKIIKSLFRVLVISVVVYFGICLTLIYWPTPTKMNTENYDYSSLIESTKQKDDGSEQWVTLRDGKQLFFRLYDSNSELTLILLHGSGSDSRYLSQLAAFLSKNNTMRVITPDLRGHGRFQGKRGDIDYIGQLDHDIEDLIAHVKKFYRGTNIVLGGHSSGGGMALRYVGNESVSQPDGLLLIAPYLGHESPTVKPNSGEWVTVALKRWIGLEMINNLSIIALNKLPVLLFNRPDEWNDNLQVESYSYRMAVNFAPNHYLKDIARISVPTLVLIGENDESFYSEKFSSVFDTTKTNIELHIVDDANHMNIVDIAKSRKHLLDWSTKSEQFKK